MNETPVGVPTTLVEITVDGETVAVPERAVSYTHLTLPTKA